jgi:hypothetical protein
MMRTKRLLAEVITIHQVSLEERVAPSGASVDCRSGAVSDSLQRFIAFVSGVTGGVQCNKYTFAGSHSLDSAHRLPMPIERMSAIDEIMQFPSARRLRRFSQKALRESA